MSNIDIDKIYGEEALKQVDLMSSKLAENVQQVDKITSSVSAMNKAFGASTGGGGVKEQIKQVDELAKANDKLAFALSEEGKELAIVRENLRQVNAENKIAAQYNLALEGTYEKMDAELKQLNLQYKRYVALNKESTESAKDLQARIVALTDALKKDDAQRGITNRLVGDYKNQLQGLEVQIKNNITAYNNLTDAEKRSTIGSKLKTDTADLGKAYYNMANGVSSGTVQMLKFEEVIKKQPSGLDKVASSVGSVWSVIRQAAYILPGVGIAGIMGFVFSGIDTVVSNLDLLGGAVTKAMKGIVDYKDALKNTSSAVGEEIAQLQHLYTVATDTTESYKTRKSAVDELQKLYPNYLKNVSDEAIMSGKVLGIYNDINKALVDKAIFQAYSAQASEVAAKLPELEKRLQDLKAQESKILSSPPTTQTSFSSGVPAYAQTAANNPIIGVQAGIKETEKQINDIKEAITNLFKNASAYSDGIVKTTVDGVNEVAKKLAKNPELKEALAIHIKFVKDDLPKFGLSDATIKALGDAYQGMYDEILTDIDNDFNTHDKNRTSNEEAELLNRELLNHESNKRIAADKAELEKKQRNERLKNTESEIQSALNIASTIETAIADKKQREFDEKNKALKSYYDNELRFIEQSGMSSSQKEKAKQKLQAETEAKQKQIDHDRITALRKAATIQKAIDIASIIAKTAIAVMADLSIPIYGELKAVATAAIGAAQLAAVIATPLPQYAKGRKGGPREFARTNELGAELHVTKEGKMYIPNEGKDGITLLEQDTKVIPHDITKQLLNSAYIKLANNGEVVTTDKLQAALLAEFERNTSEIIELKKVLIQKQFNATQSNDNYRNYKNSIIKQ